MALTPRRHRFGASSADTTQSVGEGNVAVFEPNHTLWVYDAKTGGTRLTDLLDANLAPITEVVSGVSGGIPEFYGPLDITDLWISSASGASPESNGRTLLAASDLKTDIDELDAAIDAIEGGGGTGTVTSVAGVSPTGGDVQVVPLRTALAIPSDTSGRLLAIESRAPAVLVFSGAGYPAKPSWATFAIFIGSVDPGAASANGDIWLQPASG